MAEQNPTPPSSPAPSVPLHTEPDRVQRLRHMKRLALGLLLACVGLLALAHQQGRVGPWAWVAAFAEAAVVGALADWFAVVALFRRPLGLPFPHTAIVPRKKARLADQLAVFMRDRFLDTPVLLAKLRDFDPLRLMGAWLQDPVHADQLGRHLQGVLVDVLDNVDDQRIRRLLQTAVTQRLEQMDLSQTVGELLQTLTAQGRHQALFEQALRQLAAHIDTEPVQHTLASVLVDIAGKEYPLALRAIGLITNTEEFGLKLAAATGRGLTQWVHEVCEDPQHPRRLAFDATVAEWIERLRHDRDFAEQVNAAKQRWLQEPVLQDYVRGLWDELRAWLVNDLKSPQSHLREQISAAARRLGNTLVQDTGLRAALQTRLETALAQSAPALREQVAEHIARTVRSWPDAQLVEELELGVGRDLQFIRLNGTVVGGLIGVGLHAVSRLWG